MAAPDRLTKQQEVPVSEISAFLEMHGLYPQNAQIVPSRFNHHANTTQGELVTTHVLIIYHINMTPTRS